MSTFFARYKSSDSSGCPKEFMSIGTSSSRYPPMVQYACDVCKGKIHNFRLVNTTLVDTPKRVANFEAYCKQNKIELGVEIPTK